MIGIQLEGDNEFLQTDPATSINIKLENPIFGNGEKLSPGSYSLPFTLPTGDRSPSNAAKIKHPDVIENNQAYQLQKATLFASSDMNAPVPFKKGNLRAKSTDKNKAQAHFTFGLNSINESFKTAKLKDVVAENFVIGATSITKKIYIKRPSGDYNVTINGIAYAASDATSLAAAINADADAGLDTGKYLPYATHVAVGSTPSGLIVNDYVVVRLSIYFTFHDDILDMDFLLRQDATDPLLELSANVDGDPENYLVETDLGTYYDEFDTFLAGYISGSYPNAKLRFPLLFNGNPYTETIKDLELVNGVNSSGLIRNESNWGLTNDQPFKVKNYNSIQPFLRRKWILDKIGETFGFTWEGDFYDHADVDNMLEWNSAALDYPIPFIGERKFVFWRRSFNLSELVPDITVVEYLKRLCSRYNLGLYENEITKKVRICFREPIAKNIAYEDITSISSPVLKIEDLRVSGYTLSLKKDDTDLSTSDESVTVGTSEQTIEMQCGRLFQQNTTVIEGKAVSGPRTLQRFAEKGQMRTFYYKGIVDVTTFSYPAADINGVSIYEPLNNFVLLTGMYEAFWKYWLHYDRNRRIVTIVPSFAFRNILRFDWEKKRRFDRINYLVKSIDLTITNQTIRVNSAELFTMQ